MLMCLKRGSDSIQALARVMTLVMVLLIAMPVLGQSLQYASSDSSEPELYLLCTSSGYQWVTFEQLNSLSTFQNGELSAKQLDDSLSDSFVEVSQHCVACKLFEVPALVEAIDTKAFAWNTSKAAVDTYTEPDYSASLNSPRLARATPTQPLLDSPYWS